MPSKKYYFDFPRGNFPRLVLAGNSNVGKSSLTRVLIPHSERYKGKIGKTAGSTLRLNLVDDPALKFQVIDLPGFGKMMHISKDAEDAVQGRVLKYLEIDKSNIFLCLMVISAERIEAELEKWYFQNKDTNTLSIEFIQFVLEQNIPVILVLKKIDKINHYQQQSNQKKLDQVLKDFNIALSGPDSDKGLLMIIETSTTDQTGIKTLKGVVNTRANKLKLSQFDPRNELHKMPCVGEKKNVSDSPNDSDSDQFDLAPPKR